MSSPPDLSGVHVTWSLVLSVYFVDRCLSYCTFSFFDTRFWYLQMFLHVYYISFIWCVWNVVQINCVRIIIEFKLINWEIIYQTALTGLIRKTVIFIKWLFFIPLLKRAKRCCINEYSIENRPLSNGEKWENQ